MHTPMLPPTLLVSGPEGAMIYRWSLSLMTLKRFGGIGTGRRGCAVPIEPGRRIPGITASDRRNSDTRLCIVAAPVRTGLERVIKWWHYSTNAIGYDSRHVIV